MKITIPPEFIKKLTSNFKTLNIKILEIKEKSSIISILGKRFEIPLKLDENKSYSAEIKKNELLIKEAVKKSADLILKAGEDEKVLENEPALRENHNLPFYDLLKRFFYDEYGKKKNFSFSDRDKKDYFFAFSLPVYDKESKVFLKIDKDKNVFIDLLYNGSEKNFKKNELQVNLKKKLNKEVKSLNFTYNLKEDNFYNKIFSMIALKNVDINI